MPQLSTGRHQPDGAPAWAGRSKRVAAHSPRRFYNFTSQPGVGGTPRRQSETMAADFFSIISFQDLGNVSDVQVETVAVVTIMFAPLMDLGFLFKDAEDVSGPGSSSQYRTGLVPGAPVGRTLRSRSFGVRSEHRGSKGDQLLCAHQRRPGDN